MALRQNSWRWLGRGEGEACARRPRFQFSVPLAMQARGPRERNTGMGLRGPHAGAGRSAEGAQVRRARGRPRWGPPINGTSFLLHEPVAGVAVVINAVLFSQFLDEVQGRAGVRPRASAAPVWGSGVPMPVRAEAGRAAQREKQLALAQHHPGERGRLPPAEAFRKPSFWT